jgi:hypothetical protein
MKKRIKAGLVALVLSAGLVISVAALRNHFSASVGSLEDGMDAYTRKD